MTVTAKGLDGNSGKGVEEEDSSAGFVKYRPIFLKNAKKRLHCAFFQLWICETEPNLQSLKLFENVIKEFCREMFCLLAVLIYLYG